MKLTKYEHACLDIEEADSRLIIDPGAFVESLNDVSGVNVVVITHEHFDHLDNDLLNRIKQANPDVKIFSTETVVNQIGDGAEIAQTGQIYKEGDFSLEFFGEEHAIIDPTVAAIQNVGVLVNDTLYYPGDSYTICPKAFNILAVPASAPWFKVGEALPLIEASQCQKVFATHNALLSEAGHKTTNNWLSQFAERTGKSFAYLKPGESLEI